MGHTQIRPARTARRGLADTTWGEAAMTVNEFVLRGIDDLMADAGKLAADMTDDPDKCSGIPLAKTK